jgi:hypothetical protein
MYLEATLALALKSDSLLENATQENSGLLLLSSPSTQLIKCAYQ